MTTNDGGPAFPIFPDIGNHADGMSLRDYFAANAMAAIIGTSEGNGGDNDLLCGEDINPKGQPVNKEGDKCNFDLTLKWVPKVAYKLADAMLSAREAKP